MRVVNITFGIRCIKQEINRDQKSWGSNKYKI